MQISEFNYQMDRMSAVFGPYHPERSKIIWSEVKEFAAEEWRKIIDAFVSENRYQPTITEIREKLSLVRERVYLNQKRVQAQEAKEFFMIANDDQMRGSILQTIIKRMQGCVADDVWDNFVNGLNKLVTNTPPAA